MGYIERDTRKQTVGKSDTQHLPIQSSLLSSVDLSIHSLINLSPFLSHRLVMYIERDTRKQTLAKSDIDHMPVHLSVHPSVHLSVHPFIHSFIYPSLSLSFTGW